MADYEISTRITADSSSFTNGMNKAKKSTSSLSDSISDVIKDISGGKGLSGSLSGVVTKLGLVGVAVGATTKAIKKTIQTVKECNAEYSKFESGQRVLAQTLKVTGAQEWTNINNLKQMQQQISKTTNYSTGEIQQLQTVLLGFKSIKGDVFDQTTDAILDMATVMGMDLTSATQTVAKALDDPIKGLGSLSRQGFVFTEQQKALIQSLVDSGKQFEAQKIILEELQTTYGGASRKAVDASTVLKNQTSEFKKALGAITNPVADGWDIFWTRVFDKGTKTLTDLKKTQEELGVGGGRQVGADLMSSLLSNQTALIEFYQTGEMSAENQKKILEYINNLNREDLELYKSQLGSLRDRTDLENYILVRVENRSKAMSHISKQQKIQQDAQNKVFEKEQAQEELNKKIADIKESHNESMAKQVREWEIIEQVTGKEVSLEEKLKAYQDDLVSAVVEANGGITEGNEFYKSRMKIIEDLLKQISELNDEEVEDTEETAEEEESIWRQYAEQVVSIFKKIGEKIKSIFNGIKSVAKTVFSGFKKLVKINTNDLIDELLEFEDSVLTFFYSTINELPNFIDTVLTSITRTLEQVKVSLENTDLKAIFLKILNSLSRNLQPIINSLLEILQKIVPQAVYALGSWISGGGWRKMLNALLSIQTGLEKLITDNIDEIVNVIISGLPDLMETIKNSIISASNTFSKLIKPLDRLFSEIIIQLLDVITSQEVIDASIEAIGSLVEGILSDGKLINIITSILNGIARLINNSPNLVLNIVDAFVKGFFEGLTNPDNWKGVGPKIAEAIQNSFNFLNPFEIFGSSSSSSIVAKRVSDVAKIVPRYATGSNNVKSGIALVGEAGPELIDFRGGERVYNNSDTKKILNGGSVGNSFNVTFNNIQDTSAYEMMRQLKQYNRQMAINGVL